MITFNQVRDNEFGPFTLDVKTLYIKLEIFKHCSCLVGTLGIFCTWNNIRVLVTLNTRMYTLSLFWN